MNQDKIAGIIFIGSGALMVMAMLHHPFITASEPAEIVAELWEKRHVDRGVHGAMIALLVLTGYAFHYMTRGLGNLARFGDRLYGLGVGGFIGAALVSGFALPELAEMYDGKSAENFKDLLRLSFAFNQSLVKFATVMIGFALMFAAVDLIKQSGLGRWTGYIAGISGAAAAISIFTGMSLGGRNMTLIVIAFVAFYVLAGIWMLRGRPDTPPS